MNDETKKDPPKSGKLTALLTSNETVYRTWRTFLQAAVGAGAAGLVELLSGKFAGASPGRIFLYFIAVAVAAGLSAVMNRSGKKLPEDTVEILGELTEGLTELSERLEGKEPEEESAAEGSGEGTGGANGES